jgi:hypothetical protein
MVPVLNHLRQFRINYEAPAKIRQLPVKAFLDRNGLTQNHPAPGSHDIFYTIGNDH